MPRDRRPVILERRFIPKGAIVMREGEEGFFAYLIQSGTVQAFTMVEGRRKILGTIGVGEIFGEMALFNSGRRTASVVALEDCNLILITRQALEEKLYRSDQTIRAIVNMMIRRLADGNNVIANRQVAVNDLEQVVNSLCSDILETLPKSIQPRFQNDIYPLIDQLGKRLEHYRHIAQDE